MSPTTTLAKQDLAGEDLKVVRGGWPSFAGGGVLAAIVVFLAVAPWFVFSPGDVTNLVTLFALIILGTTWNLMAGYGGLVSIGQQAFIGAGGYGVIKLADVIGLPIPVAVVAAGVVCSALAIPTSFLLFRLVGGYFAIGTWVVAEVFKLVTQELPGFGGGSGLSLTAFQGVDRVTRIATVYYLALVLAVLVVLATYVLMRSRIGLGLTAIRDDSVAAASLGVAVRRSQRIVYVAASGGAGLAGALIAVNGLRVSPDSMFSVQYTAFMIFIVVIGGLGTIEGPILGALIFFALQQLLDSYGTWYLVALGAVAIAVVLLAPRGLWGLAARGRYEVFPIGHTVHPPD